jgi:predicted component of type VI protein secretion system
LRDSHNFKGGKKMKNFFALVIVGSMLLSGCNQNQPASEHVINEDAFPVAEQEVTIPPDNVIMEQAVDLELDAEAEAVPAQEQEAEAAAAAVQE